MFGKGVILLLFLSLSRIFHSYGDGTFAGEGLQFLTFEDSNGW